MAKVQTNGNGSIYLNQSNQVLLGNDMSDDTVVATGSTEPRTLADRFADVVNVKDFGAKGDGTTDDTIAINAAYDDAYGKSARVFFPAGTYKTTDNITNFFSIIAVGDGKIKRDGNIFYVGETNTNKLYASTNGTGDGLSDNFPASLSNISSYFSLKGVLYHQWYVYLAAGNYTEKVTFSGFDVQQLDGLVIKGVTPDRVNNIWTTIFTYPDDNVSGACIYVNNVKFIRIENISFVGSDVGSGANSFNGLYFMRGMNSARVFNCKFDNFNYGDCICCQNCNQVFASNCIFQNSRTGMYVYNSTGSTLSSNNTRNLFKNCIHGLYITGYSYMHNDHNDFEDCTECAYVDKGAYCGWNDCTETNCTTIFKLEGCSVCNMDNAGLSAATGTTDKLYTIGCIRGNNYELYKQGNYNPNRGVNGAWNYGFDDFVDTQNPVVYNVSSDGKDCTRRNTVNNNFILAQSKDNKTGFAILCPLNAAATQGQFLFYDETNTVAYSGFGSYNGAINVFLDGGTKYIFNTSFLRPNITNSMTLGSGSYLWKEIFCANATINTSDERQKQDIAPINEAVFRAWSKVNFIQYKFKDAVAKKGEENARIHFGVIAQHVKEAFESEGLDAFKYGLLCYDEWEAEPEEKDEEGNVVNPGHEAGNAYGIRYSEALALECAYQRHELEQLKAQLNK